MTNKNLCQILVFISLFLGINYLISSDIVRHDTTRKSQIELRNSILREMKLDTIIMGDSQALRGINPQKFSNAYNYAAMGENGILTYYKLHDLVQRRAIKDLILTVNLHSFSDYRGDLFSKIYIWRELINFFELAIEKHDPLILINYVKAYFFVYEHFARGIFQTEFQEEIKKPRLLKMNYYKGFNPLTFERFNDVTERVNRYFADQNPYDASLIKYHQKIFALCKQKGIRVHLVRMPISKDFQTKASKYINDYDYLALMEQFQRQYDNVELFDMINLFEGNKEEMFFDDLHLNNRGAGRLSKELSSRMYKQGYPG